ncbi:MAG: carbon-nitrogen hydrolase family protein [Acidobacteriota bacterium]|nr:carbon-nitrogen hydrolase family protein [Acidobacteriota bacterium]
MSDKFLAAVVQLQSGSDEDANLSLSSELIERAAGYGATLVSTPENTNYLGPHKEKVRLAEGLDGKACTCFAELAAKHGIHLVLGSFNERSDEETRCLNTSVYFGPDGEIRGVYRKIHLFDVDVSKEVCFKESATIQPGKELVVVDDAVGAVGLSVCYDLRFPELYAQLVAKGAQILTVPSAFTLMTGKDHWYPLLCARAIETQSYVLAAAQWGKHDDKGLRQSYGHSVIIDPWGQVIGSAPEGPGLALAEIDLDRVASTRRSMPVESHRRL